MSPSRGSAAAGGLVVARNPKARHDYHILETWEAGLVLTGTEVKSVRAGKVSLKEAFGIVHGGEVWLEAMTISPYESGGYVNHDPRRRRKLLLHTREIRRLIGAVHQKGLTLIPLDLYFARGRAKVTLALARGKQLHDKREAAKRRIAAREAERAMGRRP
ncbi:MAG: SsrA-binding protein SmpB [Gemmatimonadetes bacterium]|nr:SsrA-binding protein SmpB [Gemmatimonadota bacterium]